MKCLRCPRPAQPHVQYCTQCQRDAVMERLCWDISEASRRAEQAMRELRGRTRTRIIREGLG